MGSVAVVIPWRDTGCFYRRRNLNVVRSTMERIGWRAILADDTSCEDFNRSAARNRGVELADADIVIINDADVIVPNYYLTSAVARASRQGGINYPYRRVLYLDEQGTQEIIAGKQIKRGRVILRERNAHGGCMVVRRDEYLSSGGFDETFEGWGYEDAEFFNRVGGSIGSTWGAGDAHHMWHPRPKRDVRTQLNKVKATRQPAGCAFVIVPTHTQPGTLSTLLERAGLPCIVIHTDPASRDIDGAINLRDEGPVNIQRWWNVGIREAESRGADMVVIANHDAVPSDSGQLAHMVEHLRNTGASVAMAHAEDTDTSAKVKRTGHAFALNLNHGIRPDERFRWYYGDTFIELQAKLVGHGVVGARAKVKHHKPRGPRYSEELAPLVAEDHELYEAESKKLASLPDVVYRVRPGDNNDELRQSLRSLTNVPHRRVWMIGHKPSWCSDAVHHIPGDRKQGKWHAIYDNVIRACEHPDISERFILIDDDQFIMVPMEEIPIWHLGTLDGRIETLAARRGRDGDWQDTLQATYDYLRHKGIEEPISYEVHAPLVIDKAVALPLLIEAQAWPSRFPPQARSVYGNLANIGGEQRRDTKVIKGDAFSNDIVSTSDASYRRVRKVIEPAFPTRCKYER